MINIRLFEVTHKDDIEIIKGRTPIYVGTGENTNQYIRDNTGDNIAEKNNSFCELTAFYYAWKNLMDIDYIGFEHYRRFFKGRFSSKPVDLFEIESILSNNEMIIAQKYNYKISNYDYYVDKHIKTDMDTTFDTIKNCFPDYIEAYKSVMEDKYLSGCNMMITSKQIFDEYCYWLFKVLFEVEKKTDLTNRDSYQKRVFGFLSERLQCVWIKRNKIKTHELPVYYLDQTKIKSVARSYMHEIRGY